MTDIFKIPVISGSAALLLTASLASLAAATPLPDMDPEQIRLDTQQTFDAATGITETVAPSFDPFELDETLAGTAALRSVTTATTIDGRQVSGGAFLDLSLFYTTQSNDIYDVRGVDQGIFVSGDPIDTIRYDSQILDCSENVREVVYDDNYYSGARYGYIAGVYRLFPRYRGHRGFGRYPGYGYGGAVRGHRGRQGVRHGIRGHNHDDRGRNYHDQGHNDGRADRHEVDETGNDYRARIREGLGDRVRGGRGERVRDRDRRREHNNTGSGRDRAPTVAATNGELVKIPTTSPRAGSTGRNQNDRRGRDSLGPKERVLQEMRSGTGRDYKKTVTESANPPRTAPAPQASRQRRGQRRRVSTPAAQPQVQPVPTSNRRSQARTAPAPVKTPRSRTVKTRSNDSAAPARRSSPKSISRATDRHFGGKSPRARSGKKIRNFFPPKQIRGYTRSDVYVSYRCAREETVTLHVSQDRIDAARFDGFTVLLLDRDGNEIPVYVPPNYVEGFRRATGAVSYTPPAQNSRYTRYPEYSQEQPQSGYPQPEPSSDQPIIYGDPTGL